MSAARPADPRPVDTTPTTDRVARAGRNLLAGILFGLGTVAFIDEAVFHQLLHWHHFYDRSTTEVGLVSDGLFHAFGWFAVVAGLFWFAALRRQHAWHAPRWTGGLCVGAGAFQLYDGTVQHKLLHLHQIRYQVDLLAYDLTWNLVAVAMISVGGLVLVRSRAVPAGRAPDRR